MVNTVGPVFLHLRLLCILQFFLLQVLSFQARCASKRTFEFDLKSTAYLETELFKPAWSQERADIFWGRPREAKDIKDFVTKALTSIDVRDAPLEPKVNVLVNEPPLVCIDNFLSETHCTAIIQAALNEGFSRSTVGIDRSESENRTSSTTWLFERSCMEPLRLLAERVSRISGLPPSHMENLQVVRYNPGEQFAIHTDHQDTFNDLPGKGRLCTCLVYLHEPISGGETTFFEFDLSLPPKRGSAVFWWNTVERPGSEGYRQDMPLHADLRMRHAGAPVLEGQKWICNRWVHPVDYGRGIRGYNRFVP